MNQDNPPNFQLVRVGVFKGDWQEKCEICGEPQLVHRETEGPRNGELIEWRKPCAIERETMERTWEVQRRFGLAIEFVGWILVPLCIAILGFTNYFVGLMAFAFSLLKIGITAAKLFGNPDKWIPGHRAAAEKERKMKHYFWHCERNPAAFARLRDENIIAGVPK